MLTGNNESLTRLVHDSDFHQQRMAAWKPEITMIKVYPVLLVYGLLFLIIGGSIISTSSSLTEYTYDYTNCKNENGEKCDKLLTRNLTAEYGHCNCKTNFTLTKISGPVFLYYQLSNFYQHHRRFLKSRDEGQLQGYERDYNNIDSNCEPFRREKNGSLEFIYAPCGLVANSLFNDTFRLTYINGTNQEINVPMTSEGIAWSIDRDLLYNKPKTFNNTLKPPNWKLSAPERNPNSYKDEELMVWMRTAPLPTFRKLHRIVNLSKVPFNNHLPAGNYVMYINYSYPVTAYSGRKYFLITNTNSMGGKNEFLGAAFLTVGTIQVILSILYIIIPTIYFKYRPRKDDTEISNQVT